MEWNMYKHEKSKHAVKSSQVKFIKINSMLSLSPRQHVE